MVETKTIHKIKYIYTLQRGGRRETEKEKVRNKIHRVGLIMRTMMFMRTNARERLRSAWAIKFHAMMRQTYHVDGCSSRHLALHSAWSGTTPFSLKPDSLPRPEDQERAQIG